MIQFLRSKVASLIAKILFGLLILSFAVWGIGDVFRGGAGANTVAEVAGQPVTVVDLDNQFRNDVAQMRRIFGPQFTAAQAQQMGMMHQSLATLIDDRLLDVYAGRLGYRLDDQAVANVIRSIDAFRDPNTGQFSRPMFLQILQQNGLTEAGYVAMVRRDAGRQALLQAVAAGATVPQALTDPVLRWRRESRDVEVVSIAAGDQPAPTPQESDLVAFLGDSPDRFLSPEYRVLTVVDMHVDDILATVTVSETDVEDYYQSRLAEFSEPERRRFEQVIAGDEAMAREIAAALRDGASADEVAAGVTGASSVPIDPTTQADMPLPALGSAGFALEVGEVSDPVQSPFGWHVVALREILPAGTEPLEDVRAGIEERLRIGRALDQLYDRGNRLEDAIADGLPVAEAAMEAGFTAVTLPPVAQDGTTRDGTPLPEGTPPAAQLLPTAFQLQPGGTSRMTQAGESRYFVVHVDEVIAPAPQPLAAVRAEVEAAWIAARQAEAAAATAERVRTELAAGGDAEAVAAEVGGQLVTVTGLMRDGGADGVPSSLVEPIFELSTGQAAAAATPQGHAVARLTRISVPDPRAESEAAAQIAETLGARMSADLSAQFLAALRGRLGVTYYDAALSRLNYEG